MYFADKEADLEGWEEKGGGKGYVLYRWNVRKKKKALGWIKFLMANIFTSGARLSSEISVLGEFLLTKPTHSQELLHM